MLTIGFTTKFYTLWNCYTTIKTLSNGVRIICEHNEYIKNISFDRKKAQELYPDVPIDENLKGITRSFTNTRKEYPNNVFKYGKYEGKLFDEVTDYDYMKWYFTTTTTDQQDVLKPILVAQGYSIFTCSDGTYGIKSPKEIEEERLIEQEQQEKRTRLLESMIFFIDHNCDENGEYLDYESGLRLKFDEVRENWYGEWNYFLPVKKGKCKRIKNKSIELTKFELDLNNDIIYVHDFDVFK